MLSLAFRLWSVCKHTQLWLFIRRSTSPPKGEPATTTTTRPPHIAYKVVIKIITIFYDIRHSKEIQNETNLESKPVTITILKAGWYISNLTELTN